MKPIHGPDKIKQVADQYASAKGLTLQHGLPKAKADSTRGAKIAEAYHSAKHDPNHPEVKQAYGALINETGDQFKHILNSGLKISKIKPGQENPYKNGSKDLFHDIHNNGHMWYYPTDQGFGSSNASTSDHPMLQPTKFKHHNEPMVANDVFRIVHDYFGHAKEGHGFGAHGEESAWQTHMPMYSSQAQKALTAETRGQNSWVNFGPHGEHNRANPLQTKYADQKATILPDWTMDTSSKIEKAIKSPSKFIPLHRLKQIKQDNHIGEGGQEYSEEETHQAIAERTQGLADKAVRDAGRHERAQAQLHEEGYAGHDPDSYPDQAFMYNRMKKVEKKPNPKDPILGPRPQEKPMTEEHKKRIAQRLGLKKTDKIPGGLADNKKPSDFPGIKLRQGIKVEKEHTSDPKIAEEIAMDHLTEDPEYYNKLKTIEKSDLVKMSRPRITFPNLKQVSTRPDQNVQILETGKQKDLYGRKAALTAVKDYAQKNPKVRLDQKAATDKEAKRLSGKFDQKTLGLNSPGKDVSHSSALAGKLRSKFEDGGDEHQDKLNQHREKRNQIIRDYNDSYRAWQTKAYELSNSNHADPSVQAAMDSHRALKPEKPKLPRKPAKKLVATSDLAPEQMASRGRAVDSTIEHEGFHNLMDQIERRYGQGAAIKVKQNLIQQHDPKTLEAVGNFIADTRGYKRDSGSFGEEILTHTRDLLVDPKKREDFKRYVRNSAEGLGQDNAFNNHIKNLKQGHQKAYNFAQNLKPENLADLQIDHTRLASSEKLTKTPAEYPPRESSVNREIVRPKGKEIHSVVLPNGLTYRQTHTHDFGGDAFTHQIFHPDVKEPLAEIRTYGSNPNNPMETQNHKVSWSQVHPEFKGRGLGKIAYKAALMHGKGIGRLQSDKDVSLNAHKAWLDFKNVPGVRGRIGKYARIKDFSDPKKQELVDMAHEDRHEAYIPNKKVVDQNKMFPQINIASNPKKLAASEEENE